MIVKFFAKSLIRALKKLKVHYEIIVFTVIPSRFLDLIIAEIPQFN